MDQVKTMKKVLNKIGQALQMVLLAPVKLPAKLGNGLRYLALVLGLLETLLEEEQQQPDAGAEVADKVVSPGDAEVVQPSDMERSVADEAE